MKYDSLRKTQRNKKLVEYADKNKRLSQAEIGKKFGISASRVSKLLKALKEAHSDNG